MEIFVFIEMHLCAVLKSSTLVLRESAVELNYLLSSAANDSPPKRRNGRQFI